MPQSFNESGCDQCRRAWTHPREKDAVLKQMGKTNFERQARLYKCVTCGTFWEDPNGNYPCVVSAAEVREFYGIS